MFIFSVRGLSPYVRIWRLQTSDSHAYRRQILTYKDNPRAERVNPYPADHDYYRLQPILLVDQITDSGKKCVFKHKDLQIFGPKWIKYA